MKLKLFLLISVILPSPLWAADTMRRVITPSSDNVVVEKLPNGPRLSSVVSSGSAESVSDQITQIQEFLNVARQQGDPRYLGYVGAQLPVLLAKYPADPNIRLLHARFLQADHQFVEAEKILDELLKTPSAISSEAALLSASIALVRGQYSHAMSRCQQLSGFSMLPFALICKAQVMGSTGSAAEALKQLNKVPVKQLGLTDDQLTWWQLSRADIADRLGLDQDANGFYQNAAALGSAEATAAYADWLYWQGDARSSLAVLKSWTAHDGLLTLLTRAEIKLGLHKSAIAHKQQVQSRWQAFLARKEPGHERELAVFYLDVMQQPETALNFARKNWATQRETADYRIYLRTSLALSASKDLSLLAKWQSETGFEDVRAQSWLTERALATASSAK